MKVRFAMTLVCAVFTLGLYSGCSEDPVVKEMEDWADKACACEDITCVGEAAVDLQKKAEELGDKRVTQEEKDKVEAAMARATKCIEGGNAKYAASAGIGGGAGGGSGLDGGQEYQLSSAQDDLKEIKEKLAKGEEVSKLDCISIDTVIKELASLDNADVKALIEEGGKLCNYDAPLARVTAWKSEVEEGAKKGGLNSACFDVNKTTLDELVKSHPTDVAVKDISSYIQANCKK